MTVANLIFAASGMAADKLPEIVQDTEVNGYRFKPVAPCSCG